MRSKSRKCGVQTERYTVFQTQLESFSSPRLSSGVLVISHGILECPSLNDHLFSFQFQFVFVFFQMKLQRKSWYNIERALKGRKKRTGLICIFFFRFYLSIPFFITYLLKTNTLIKQIFFENNMEICARHWVNFRHSLLFFCG